MKLPFETNNLKIHVSCYIYIQQKQEIWLAVYSRSNLIVNYMYIYYAFFWYTCMYVKFARLLLKLTVIHNFSQRTPAKVGNNLNEHLLNCKILLLFIVSWAGFKCMIVNVSHTCWKAQLVFWCLAIISQVPSRPLLGPAKPMFAYKHIDLFVHAILCSLLQI